MRTGFENRRGAQFYIGYPVILIALVLFISACIQAPRSPPEPAGTSSATVTDVEIRILESFPVHVHATVRGYTPDSCTAVGEVKQRREGSTFYLTIGTERPAEAICAQVLTSFETGVSLEVYGLKAGRYTVDVHGVKGTFELQSDNILK